MTDPSQEPVEQVTPVDEEAKPPFHVPVPENRDPGNTDPAHLTEDLSDEELLEANAAVEEAISSLPKDNGGVIQ